MKLLSLLKELSLHPKNAEELKGLILQLAVYGKLTANWRETNTSVENTSVLLEKIVSYNEEQLKKKKRRIKKLSTDPNIVLDLPNNWIQTKNHVLFSLAKGKNPKDLSETVKKYPYQDIESLARGNVRRYSDDEKALKCSVDDILVVCDGSRSGLVLDGKDGIVGSTLAIIETPPFTQSYIKLLFLQGYQKANSTMKGAAIPHLDTQTLLSSDIGLPPLEEQKAIVEVVKQLFTEVEQLEELTKERISLKEDFVTSALRRLTETDNTTQEWNYLKQHFSSFFTEKKNIKSLRETILQLAVQGKLTAKWRDANPSVEHASELLKRIEAEKQQLIAEKKMRKDKPLPLIVEEDKSFELPSSWIWCRLMNITILITDGKHGNCQDEADSGYYFLSAKDVQKGKLLYERARQINYKEFAEIHQRTALKAGDLCIVNTGATVGKTAIVQEDPKTEKSTFQKSVAVVKMLPQYVDVEYIEGFIKAVTPSLLKTSGGSAINNLLLGDMRMLMVPFPPFEEQLAIVEKANSLMALCDELEQQIDNSQTQIEQLMQSCLKEVFEQESN